MLSFVLDRAFVDQYRVRPEPFGFGALGAVTFYRTYSRIDDNGRYESWADACERIINGMYSIQKDHCLSNGIMFDNDKAMLSAREAFDRLFNFKWSPPGRGLSHMGAPSVHERGMYEAVQNCAFISTEHIRQHRGALFSWIMEMLMLGVGVGSDVRGAGKVDIVAPSSDAGVTMYVIPDSREGWADSLAFLVNSYMPTGYNKMPIVKFDYSGIRPAGSLIKGFGGIASGPEPLKWMHEKVRSILDENCNLPITAVTLADIINMIGVVVVAGNVRRSSEILLGSKNDTQFANLKNAAVFPDRNAQSGWSWASNNSILGEVGMDYSPYLDSIMENGEPGFLWSSNVNSYARMNGVPDARDLANGTNPCFAPGTLVQTRTGHYPIESLVGSVVDIWDGNNWITVDNFRITGKNQKMLRITMQDGSEIDVTPYHILILEDGRRIEARILLPGEALMESNAPQTHGNINAQGAYACGFMVGDGTVSDGVPSLWLYGDKKACGQRIIDSINEIPVDNVRSDAIVTPSISRKLYSGGRDIDVVSGLSARKSTLVKYGSTYKRGLPSEVFAWSLESKAEFIAGLFDSDGSAQDGSNGFGYQITSVYKGLLLDVQAMLKTIGVQSKVKLSKAASVANFNDGYGEYKTKELWRLSIAQAGSIKLSSIVKFSRLQQLTRQAKNKSTLRWNTVVSVCELEETCESVYCCTVDTTHSLSISCGIMSGNCGEQPLYGYSPAGIGGEMCTLCEVYLPHHANKYDFYRSLKFAYLYGKTITLLSDKMRHPGTRDIMTQNRRIGLSLTGIAQFTSSRGVHNAIDWMDNGYKYVQHYDHRYSDWFDVNRSLRTTSIKPSGTVSLVAGVTPGVHFPHSVHYIRRMRLAESSHLVKRLEAAGIPIEPSVTSSNTVVASFPVYNGGNLRPVSEVSIWEQFQMAAMAQRYWSDNSVSVTISINPKTTTKLEVKNCLDHFQHSLKSVSLLPLIDGGAYAQMPYEEITEDQFVEMDSRVRYDLLASLSGDKFDGNNKMADMYCDGDACEIKVVSDNR